MSVVNYSRNAQIDSVFTKILTQNGFEDTANAPFLTQFISAVKSAFREELTSIYDIASQTDLGRATGEYLDRWGGVLNEPRAVTTYATDTSLSNVYIELYPSASAGDLTSTGEGIPIPKGQIIHDTTSTNIFQTLDDVVIPANGSRVYVRVIAVSPGALSVPANTLNTIDYSLADISTVKSTAATTYSLVAGNDVKIESGSVDASDEVYRYVLSQKAKSWGLVNQNRYLTLMDIPEIVNIITKEIGGGVHVYLDTKSPQYDELCRYIAEKAIRAFGTKGIHFRVLSPVYRSVVWKLGLIVDTDYDAAVVGAQIKAKIATIINNTAMGAAIDLGTILESITESIPGISYLESKKFIFNGNELISGICNQQFNEKAQITIQDITIS